MMESRVSIPKTVLSITASFLVIFIYISPLMAESKEKEEKDYLWQLKSYPKISAEFERPFLSAKEAKEGVQSSSDLVKWQLRDYRRIGLDQDTIDLLNYKRYKDVEDKSNPLDWQMDFYPKTKKEYKK